MSPDPAADRVSLRAVARAVAGRPDLWAVALLQGARLASPGWWRIGPRLPRPSPPLWRFRMETAYGGDGGAKPTVEDVRAYLEWCRGMGHWRRG